MKLKDLVDLPVLETPAETVIEGSDENGTFHKAPPAVDRFVTTAQAAKIQHVSPSRIRQKIAKKQLHAKRPVEGRRDSLLDRREVIRDAKREHKKTGRPKGT